MSQVFCDETVAALKTYAELNNLPAEGTVMFLQLMIRFWKIVNVHSPGADVRYRDLDRGVLRSPNDAQLDFLLEVALMADEMKPPTAKGRLCQLTRDTSKMIAHTCRGLVDLSLNLLNDKRSYVILGWFSTDPLEKTFGQLRQGCGGTYFISAQSVLEKLNIQRANLALKLQLSCLDEENAGHSCKNCNRKPSDQECEILDNLAALEKSINTATLNALVYVAGYIQFQAGSLNECSTKFYADKYGLYMNNINRGGLIIPEDMIVQWIIYCYIFFVNIHNIDMCRNFLISCFEMISEKFSFNVSVRHARVLGNIFLKNVSLLTTPKSYKEASLKAIKLS